MATLLVAIAVMSVLMSAILPAWRHQAQREKEAELIFRGEQYVRAIQLWERRMGPGSRPPNVDILVQQKFLRKKYTDPMTEDGEFQLIVAGLNPTPAGRGRGGQLQQPQPPLAAGQQQLGGGIHGVQSKSTEPSIRVYRGATRYNEWRFIHAGAATTPGAPGGGPLRGRPGGRGPGGLEGPGRRGAPGRGFPGVSPFGPGSRGTSDGRGTFDRPGTEPGRGRGQ